MVEDGFDDLPKGSPRFTIAPATIHQLQTERTSRSRSLPDMETTCNRQIGDAVDRYPKRISRTLEVWIHAGDTITWIIKRTRSIP